jgi:rod shape-determining protein MreC
MFGFLKRMSAPLTVALLLLVALNLILGDRRSQFDSGGGELVWWQGWLLEIAVPVQKLVTAPFSAAGRVWHGYLDLVDVKQENKKLRAKLLQLEEMNLQFQEALVATGHLERIVSMQEDFETPMLPTRVTGLDVNPFYRSLLLDRGSQHGVAAGNPVVTDAGVVGLVTRTSSNAAKAMLVLDRQSAIDALLQRSRTRGLLRGRGSSELEFEFVSQGGDVRVGDIAITSGLGGVYPKGLRLGEVTELKDSDRSLMRSARLRPAVDFGRLEQVFVMLRRGSTMDLLYGNDGPADEPIPEASAAIPAPAMANAHSQSAAPGPRGGP